MYGRASRYSLLLLLWAGCDASLRVVPDGGRIVLATDAAHTWEDSLVRVTACAQDGDGFPVVGGTRIWVRTTAGAFEGTSSAGSDTDLVTCGGGGDPTAVLMTRGDDGCATADLCAPPGPDTLTLEAWSGPVPSATLYVEVEPVPSDLTVAASPALLSATGGTTRVGAQLFSRYGREVADATVLFEADAGTLIGEPALATNAAGQASIQLDTDRTTRVTATVLGVGDTSPVTVTITVSPPTITVVDPSSLVVTSAWDTDDANQVDILGTGFARGATVTFAGRAAEVLSSAETLLRVHPPAPESAAELDVAIDVTVTNPNGESATRSGAFVYRSP